MAQNVTYRVYKTCVQLACALVILVSMLYGVPFFEKTRLASALSAPDLNAPALSTPSIATPSLATGVPSLFSALSAPSLSTRAPSLPASSLQTSAPSLITAANQLSVSDASGTSTHDPFTNANTHTNTLIKINPNKQGGTVSVGSTSVDSNPENVINEAMGSDSSFVYETEIAALNNQPHLYDRRTVQVTGEVVGDIIKAEDPHYRWLIIQDLNIGSDAQISLYVTPVQAQKIDKFGRYGVRGSIIKATGMFQEVDPELEGAQSLRTSDLVVLEKGVITKPPFRLDHFMPGFFAVFLGCVVLYVFYRAHERQR